MATEFKEGTDQLLIPESLTNVPRSRLKDASRARDLANQFASDSDTRDQFFAMLNRQLDGNPPYDQTELDRAGQSYRANFNTMEASAIRDVAVTPHYDIYSGGQLYFYVKLSHKKLGVTPELAKQWSDKISEHINRAVDEWYGFDANNQPVISDKVWFGKGFWYWPDENDWRYEYVPQHLIKVPQGATNNIEKLDILIILHSYRVHELYEKIRQKKAEDRGWHIKTCLEAMANASPGDPKTGNTAFTDYIGLQQSINDNDLWTGYYSDVINTASIYVKEFNGKITHGIVCMDPIRKDKEKLSNSYAEGSIKAGDQFQEDWLYHKIDRYDGWRNFIAPFFLKNSNGSWNGSHGLGKDIHGMMQAKIRLENEVWNLAFLDTGIWLQANNERSLQDLSLIQAGAFNVIPPGLVVQQTQIRGNMADPMAQLDHADQLLQRNTGIYRQPFMDRQKGNPPTLGQVQLAYQDRTQLSNSMVSRSYRDFDKAYTELVRRYWMSEEFKEFVTDEPLPESVLNHKCVEAVKASRVIGNGSPQNRIFAIQQTASVFPRLPGAGQNNWVDDLIAATADRATVERWNPKPQSYGNNDHQRMAQIENGTIRSGGAVDPSDTDDDATHLDVHINAKAMALQSIQQGADPLQVVDFADRLGQHEPLHWQRLSQDESRKDQFTALAELNAKLLQALDQVRGMVDGQLNERSQAAAQAEKQRMDPLTEVKVQKEQMNMQMKAQKHQQQMAIKADQAAQQRIMTQQDMALKDAETAAGIRRESQKTEADIANQQQTQNQEE